MQVQVNFGPVCGFDSKPQGDDGLDGKLGETQQSSLFREL